MQTIHDITTKVVATEFWLWHYEVFIYDDNSYELYEMSRPMDRNWVCIMLSYWNVKDWKFLEQWYDWYNSKSNSDVTQYIKNSKEIPIDELMLPVNEDIRTAIKIKQENFYITD